MYWLSFDPLEFLMDEIECSHPKCNLLMSGLQIVRMYLLVMCSYGGIRILVIIVGMIYIAFYKMHCLVNAMYTSLIKPGFCILSKYVQFYSELQILFTMAKLQYTLTFFLMGTGIFMTILANFISIKMFQALPIFVCYLSCLEYCNLFSCGYDYT